MNKRIKVHISHSGKTIRLSTRLSNHNIAVIWFEQDGVVMDGESNFFSTENHNWWTAMYVGPWWKYIFSRDNKCYGTTVNPLEGLIACKQMMEYFINNILNEHDIIEVSGSTIQRDIIYERALKSMGFRYTYEYFDADRIMIFVKDSTPEMIVDDDGTQYPNPGNAWTYLSIRGIYFPEQPYFTEDDYDYPHLTPISRTIFYVLQNIWSFFKRVGKRVGMWVEYKMTGMLFNIKLLFSKKRKRHRHGVQD